jgi:uncharacterized protein (DUF488 family)
MDHTDLTSKPRLLSIGFTGKSAESFFTLLKEADVRTLIDVRLQNTSQLAGFAKKEDLKFFLKEICEVNYLEIPELHPEPTALKNYKNKVIDWNYYASEYTALLNKRSVEKILSPSIFKDACLLCSEHQPHKCHRRLAIEYLNSEWKNCFKVAHLT